MASKRSVKNVFKLVSTEGKKYFYIMFKNPKKDFVVEKRKYHPVLRKHVMFKEARLK